eukprot:2002791-Rhodomonas_salina.1
MAIKAVKAHLAEIGMHRFRNSFINLDALLQGDDHQAIERVKTQIMREGLAYAKVDNSTMFHDFVDGVFEEKSTRNARELEAKYGKPWNFETTCMNQSASEPASESENEHGLEPSYYNFYGGKDEFDNESDQNSDEFMAHDSEDEQDQLCALLESLLIKDMLPKNDFDTPIETAQCNTDTNHLTQIAKGSRKDLQLESPAPEPIKSVQWMVPGYYSRSGITLGQIVMHSDWVAQIKTTTQMKVMLNEGPTHWAGDRPDTGKVWVTVTGDSLTVHLQGLDYNHARASIGISIIGTKLSASPAQARERLWKTPTSSKPGTLLRASAEDDEQEFRKIDTSKCYLLSALTATVENDNVPAICQVHVNGQENEAGAPTRQVTNRELTRHNTVDQVVGKFRGKWGDWVTDIVQKWTSTMQHDG